MRDLDAISALGVPVYALPGYGGGIYLDEAYQFDQSFFTPQEIEELVLALHIADRLNQGKPKNTIPKKLELLLPELTLAKENDFYEYVKVEPLLRDFDLNNPVVQNINRGLDHDVWLDITCENGRFRVVPLYYSIGTNGISLCASDGHQKFLFSFEQITDCTETDLPFERDEFKDFF